MVSAVGTASAVGIGAVGPLMQGGCSSISEMPTHQVCDDVGYSIANRTLECTGDTDLSTHRFYAFESQFVCQVGSLDEPIDEYYACPEMIRKVDCARAKAFGDNLDLWMSADPVCARFMAHTDGSPIGLGGKK